MSRVVLHGRRGMVQVRVALHVRRKMVQVRVRVM